MRAPGVRWLMPPIKMDEGQVPELHARRTRYVLQSEQAEDVALLAGLKPLICREVPWGEAQERAEFFQQRGLCAQLRRAAPSTAWLLAGRSEAAVQEASELLASASHELRGRQRLGSLLGYPPCCVRAHVEGAEDEAERMAQIAARTQGPGEPWLNVLDPLIFRLLSWEPCSLQCALSCTYAQRLEGLLRPHFRPFLQRLRESLSSARLYLSPQVQLSLEGEPWNDEFLPRYVLPTARDRDPSSPLDPQDERAVARALQEVRATQKIGSEAGCLLLDGAPWARGFLVRFRA